MSHDLDIDPPPDRERKRGLQVIEKHYYEGNSGNGKIANDRLNAIITGIAGAAISIVLGILSMQIQRLIDKVDDQGTRITRLETKAGL